MLAKVAETSPVVNVVWEFLETSHEFGGDRTHTVSYSQTKRSNTNNICVVGVVEATHVAVRLAPMAMILTNFFAPSQRILL